MSIYHDVKTSYCFLTVVFGSWVESMKIPSKDKPFIQPTYSSNYSLCSTISSLPLVKNQVFPHLKKDLSALALDDGLQFILDPVLKGIADAVEVVVTRWMCSGRWANLYACGDGLPQTSLSCQLTRFPRVPPCQRPLESVSANT